jgi:sulfur-carrier protein
MARVTLPVEVARSHCRGEVSHDVSARDIREVVKMLELQFPGIKERLNKGLAVAIDGEIFQEWLLQEVEANSEVYFLPAIEGG